MYTHSLSVHRVACKETHDQKREVGLWERQSPTQPADHHCYRSMQPDVHAVVAPRLQPVESVVGAETEYRERSIRLVTGVRAHGPAPEIVGEYARLRTNVGVVANGEYIVVDKAAA